MATSSVRICWPYSSKKKALVCPVPLAMRNTRSDDCTTASSTFGSETRTSLSGIGNCTTMERPTPRSSRFDSGKAALAGMRRTESWPRLPGRACPSSALHVGSVDVAETHDSEIHGSHAGTRPLRVVRMIENLFDSRKLKTQLSLRRTHATERHSEGYAPCCRARRSWRQSDPCPWDRRRLCSARTG